MYVDHMARGMIARQWLSKVTLRRRSRLKRHYALIEGKFWLAVFERKTSYHFFNRPLFIGFALSLSEGSAPRRPGLQLVTSTNGINVAKMQ